LAGGEANFGVVFGFRPPLELVEAVLAVVLDVLGELLDDPQPASATQAISAIVPRFMSG
jgi:hypothetical protein